MQSRKNRRDHEEHFYEGRHLKLIDLEEPVKNLHIDKYLNKTIPEYPKPEFHVSRLKHETSEAGLDGIKEDGGFKNPKGSFIWWSLAVGPEEINDAETRILEKTFPGRTMQGPEQEPEQEPFLWKFASSPAFLETSRLGSYRFTFPLEEVLTAYRDQICSGAEPVMRVYETVAYKQEVMYTVLVHSPEFNERFSRFPSLNDDPNGVCVYKDGRFIWRSEAMCETHWYELITRNSDMLEAKHVAYHMYFVWDHVAVVLHVEKNQVLEFDSNKLRQNLKYCKEGTVSYFKERAHSSAFQTFNEAQDKVNNLWPRWEGQLEMEPPIDQSYKCNQVKRRKLR